MGDTLHELHRKELKELCSQNNIRTAGVKHEDLVRLLRNKLSPSTPQTPRTMKARGAKVHSPEKDDGVSFKTPGKAAGSGRNLRSVTLPREDAAMSQRKNPGLSIKPLLTKANTVSPRRTTNLPTKSPAGVDQDALQQSFGRRLCQINGLSPVSRKGQQQQQLGTASKASRLSVVNTTGKTEDKTSPSASEGNASVTTEVEPSDAGSDASRRVSEIATDAGPDTFSDFSDTDEIRSVSSEPVSKRSSASRRSSLRTLEPSKMSQSRLSSLATWDSSSNDKLVADGKNSVRREASEDIFPEFPEDSSFLVGDADALDLSFLHAGAADPEAIVSGDEHEVAKACGGKDHEEQIFDVMESPMARDYVTYNRGGETETCPEASRLSVEELASDRSESPGDFHVETSCSTPTDAANKHRDPAASPSADKDGDSTSSPPADKHGDSAASSPEDKHGDSTASPSADKHGDSTSSAPADKHGDSAASPPEDKHGDFTSSPPADKQRDFAASPPAEDAESKQVAHVDDLANGNEGPGLELSCNGVEHSYLGEPVPAEDVEDGPEIHSELPCLESNSPKFDSKDYRVAKKLVFEREESNSPVAPLQQPREDDVLSSSWSWEGEAGVSVASTAENQELSPSHSKSISSPAQLQESELSLTRVASEGVEDEATSTLENHVSQPEMDMSFVFVDAVSNLTSDAAPEGLDRSNSPVDEQEYINVKARDGECASSSTAVLGYSKDEREKEKLSLTMSIILWCSQLCSLISKNRTPRLGS